VERLVVVTGLSGSGKTLVVRCFEDLGYYCVDNLPVLLIPQFHDLLRRSGDRIGRAALVIDARERAFLDQAPEVLRQMREAGAPLLVLFLDCKDEVLTRRFSETRRPHPMMSAGGHLEDAIRRERVALHPLREAADRIVDTSRFTAHEIRSFIRNAFGTGDEERGPNVRVVSFGFKYGLPAEADLVFDVRFLPNPFFVEDLRRLDGTSPEVRAFLDGQDEKNAFMIRLQEFLDFLIPMYAAEGKSYLTLALGCTGGKHRSVALAEDLVEHLASKGIPASASHRDLGRE
jgi:RNase adapter protein RapZ